MGDTDTTTTQSCETELSRLIAAAREGGEPDVYSGKREWVRYNIGMRLEATRDPSNPRASWPVVTHNISGGGLGFWSKHKLTIRTQLWLRRWTHAESGEWLPAWVVHCAVGISGYLVGARFADPSPTDRSGGSDDDAAARAESAGLTHGAAGHGRPARTASLAIKCAWTTALLSSACVTVAGLVGGSLSRGMDDILIWAALIVLAAAVGGVVGWAALRREVQFLEAFATALRRIAGGESDTAGLDEAPTRELAMLRNASFDLESLLRQREDDGRLQRRKLEELNQVKSNILSIVSHDLRTPLTSILLYAQMLDDELETLEVDDQRHFLGIISEECTRLSRLVDDLLDMQRLQSGKVRHDMRPQDLSNTIISCARVFEAMAGSKSMEFVVDCPESLPPVEADSDRISQVVSNLLSNAIKYTPAGGSVRLSAESNGQEILIRVADTGPGIPRDQWDQIFDRFSQIADPDVRKIAGAGLGLYIVQQIVALHGGTVWVDSEVDRGSEFFVSLPVKATNPKTESSPEDGRPGGRVVVCDAAPELAAMIAQTLRAHDFEVRVVHSGCRLLAVLGQSDVDVVVTDVLLPDMDAAPLFEGLNAVSPRPFRLVVHSYAANGAEMRRRGVDVFLQRPASKQDIVQAVQVAMRKQSADAHTVLLVPDDVMDMTGLCALLSESGHLAILAETVSEAAERTRQYAVDVVVVAERSLGDEWAELANLGAMRDDDIQVVVLCAAIQRTQRRLAEEHDLWLLSYQPGEEKDVIDAITAHKRTPVAETIA